MTLQSLKIAFSQKRESLYDLPMLKILMKNKEALIKFLKALKESQGILSAQDLGVDDLTYTQIGKIMSILNLLQFKKEPLLSIEYSPKPALFYFTQKEFLDIKRQVEAGLFDPILCPMVD